MTTMTRVSKGESHSMTASAARQQGHVAARDPQLLHEHLDDGEVAGRPRHDVAGPQLVPARSVQVLHMAVDSALQIVLHAHGGLAADRPAQIVGDEAPRPAATRMPIQRAIDFR